VTYNGRAVRTWMMNPDHPETARALGDSISAQWIGTLKRILNTMIQTPIVK